MQSHNSAEMSAGPDYVAILRGMWRRHKTLVLCIFLGVAFSLLPLAYFTNVPLYVSRAMISIEPSGLAQIPFLREAPRRDTIATHMVLLKSRSLTEGVIDALPRESLDELLQQSQYTDYLLLVRNKIKDWLGKPRTILSPHERAIAELQKARMEFSPTKEAENVFVIAATATKPRVATDLVNTHIQVLLNRTRTTDHEDAQKAREFLESQYQQIKDSVARAEESLAKVQQQKGRLRSGGQTDVELVRLAQLESALADTQANRQILSTRIESLRRSLDQTRSTDAKGKNGQPSKEDEAAAASLAAENQARVNAYKTAQEQLAKLESKLASLRERYTEAHPQVQVTRDEVATQQARLTQLARQLPVAPPSKGPNGPQAPPSTTSERLDLQAQLASLERESEAVATKEDSLKLQVARLRGNLQNLSHDEMEFGSLRRSVEANRNLLTVLSDRLMAARIREQGDASVIRIVDPASVPVETNSAALQKLVLMILGLAGVLAFGTAFGLEVWRQPVETDTDVLKATAAPVLGSVGVMENSAAAHQKGHPGKPILLPPALAGTHASQNRPIHVELYRAIRANIETERLKSSFRTILVTSAAPGEGKSTTILNLAHAFQEFGRRMLIVEADLRRPSLASPLALTSKPGVVDFLLGTATFEQVCRRLPSGVSIIPGQVARGDAASLLASARFKELLHIASGEFDLILVDSAPVLAVPDNLLLAGIIDRVVIVAKATGTSIRDLRKAVEVVERAGGRLLGVVLNHANQHDVPYYHPRYRKYYTPAPGKSSETISGRVQSSPRGAGIKDPKVVAGRDATRDRKL